MQPVVVGFDGSAAAQAAVEAAATLFADRPLLVVSVWEPGIAVAMAAPEPDLAGLGYVGPTPEQVARLDRAQRDHAADMAETGARLARERGATAEPVLVPDERDVVETLAATAEARDACALVVGSRGLGALKAGLFGSTSRGLLTRTRLPVLIVKAPE